MKIFTASLIFVVILAYASAQSDYQGSNTGVQETPPSFVSMMSSMIVEWLSRAFAWAMEALEIKVRSVRFLSSLYTDDNLTLLKKFLNVGLRFGGWLYESIPSTVDEGSNRFLGFLFPERSSFKESDDNEQDTFGDIDDDMDLPNDLKRDTSNQQNAQQVSNQQQYFQQVSNQQQYVPQVSNLQKLINGGMVAENNDNFNAHHNQIIY